MNTTIAYETENAAGPPCRHAMPRPIGHSFMRCRTTGVYCRPSSPTRLPRRENVEFFDTAEQAEAAGYRPSRRPRPGDRTSVAARRAAMVAARLPTRRGDERLPSLANWPAMPA